MLNIHKLLSVAPPVECLTHYVVISSVASHYLIMQLVTLIHELHLSNKSSLDYQALSNITNIGLRVGEQTSQLQNIKIKNI